MRRATALFVIAVTASVPACNWFGTTGNDSPTIQDGSKDNQDNGKGGTNGKEGVTSDTGQSMTVRQMLEQFAATSEHDEESIKDWGQRIAAATEADEANARSLLYRIAGGVERETTNIERWASELDGVAKADLEKFGELRKLFDGARQLESGLPNDFQKILKFFAMLFIYDLEQHSLWLALLDDFLFPPKNTIAVTPLELGAISAFLLAKEKTYAHWAHDAYPRTNDIRLTGPFLNADPSLAADPNMDGLGYMTHSRVRVYYSDGVVNWLKRNRKGPIPDGSMIIKEMFTSDPATEPKDDKLEGYAVMIRQKNATVDGWLWYLWFVPGNTTFPDSPPIPLSQYGLSFCLSCHASTDTDQLTFSYLGNITGQDPTNGTYFSNPIPLGSAPPGRRMTAGHGGFVVASNAENSSGDTRKAPNPGIVKLRVNGKPPKDPKKVNKKVKKLPLDFFFDHVATEPTGSAPDVKNTLAYLGSDACRGCHDASYLQNNRLPNMMIPVAGTSHTAERAADGGDGDAEVKYEYYNLSEYAEWSASLMGLAGRDPVFLAQLESERALRPEQKDYISDFCLSCHAVMGQRQFHLDKKGKYFTPDVLYSTESMWPISKANDPELAKYGALARDGVSCTVCHHIIDENPTPPKHKLGTVDSFNAQFAVGPPDELYGPYDDNDDAGDPVKVLPMKRGLGITPKFGPVIGQSKLCGSCHTVLTPKIPLPPTPDVTAGDNGFSFKQAHEQTTYLEWLNSIYSDEERKTKQSKSCAECHMPNYFRDDEMDLKFQVANIEDGTFPDLPNRALAEEITLNPRPYRRHTLVAINLFTMEMFDQFPDIMGFMSTDPGAPILPSVFTPEPRLELARDEALYLAENKTVELRVKSAKMTGETLDVTVEVVNLAGHKFPSGVGFRRSFLQLKVIGPDRKTPLWVSGRTNESGEIVGKDGKPLPSESSKDWKDLQPNYGLAGAGETQLYITAEDQVQVFETRHVNNLKQLTTSFLGLFQEMKDNRILPMGWSADYKHPRYDLDVVKFTRPVRKGGDPVTQPRAIGFDRVTYNIPLNKIPGATKVEATLFYQSLPPYYLKDRFNIKKGTSRKDRRERDRLYALACYLNLKETPMQGWKLKLATADKELP